MLKEGVVGPKERVEAGPKNDIEKVEMWGEKNVFEIERDEGKKILHDAGITTGLEVEKQQQLEAIELLYGIAYDFIAIVNTKMDYMDPDANEQNELSNMIVCMFNTYTKADWSLHTAYDFVSIVASMVTSWQWTASPISREMSN